eukprot:363968-Chlamydomonas_euryale.AAC.8
MDGGVSIGVAAVTMHAHAANKPAPTTKYAQPADAAACAKLLQRPQSSQARSWQGQPVWPGATHLAVVRATVVRNTRTACSKKWQQSDVFWWLCSPAAGCRRPPPLLLLHYRSQCSGFWMPGAHGCVSSAAAANDAAAPAASTGSFARAVTAVISRAYLRQLRWWQRQCQLAAAAREDTATSGSSKQPHSQGLCISVCRCWSRTSRLCYCSGCRLRCMSSLSCLRSFQIRVGQSSNSHSRQDEPAENVSGQPLTSCLPALVPADNTVEQGEVVLAILDRDHVVKSIIDHRWVSKTAQSGMRSGPWFNRVRLRGSYYGANGQCLPTKHIGAPCKRCDARCNVVLFRVPEIYKPHTTMRPGVA